MNLPDLVHAVATHAPFFVTRTRSGFVSASYEKLIDAALLLAV